jgi:hypothetical protein
MDQNRNKFPIVPSIISYLFRLSSLYAYCAFAVFSVSSENCVSAQESCRPG